MNLFPLELTETLRTQKCQHTKNNVTGSAGDVVKMVFETFLLAFERPLSLLINCLSLSFRNRETFARFKK